MLRRKSFRALTSSESLAALLDQLGHQSGPTGLMARSYARTIVAMKVFIKWNEVPPLPIVLKEFLIPTHRTAPITSAQKDTDQPPRDLRGHLPQVGFCPRMRRALHFEVLTIIMVKLLER